MEKKFDFSKEVMEQYPHFLEVYQEDIEPNKVEWRMNAGEKDENKNRTGRQMVNCYITARTLYDMIQRAFSGKASHIYTISKEFGVVLAKISYPIVLLNGETHIVEVNDNAEWDSTTDMKKKASVSNSFKRCGPHIFRGAMWLYELPKVQVMKEGWKEGEKIYLNDSSKACLYKLVELFKEGKISSDDELVVVQKANYSVELCYFAYGKPQEIIWTAPKGKTKRYEAPKKEQEPDREEKNGTQTSDFVIYTKCTIKVGANEKTAPCIDYRTPSKSKVGRETMIEHKKTNGKETKLNIVSNGVFAAYVLGDTIYLFDDNDEQLFAVLSKWQYKKIAGEVTPS